MTGFKAVGRGDARVRGEDTDHIGWNGEIDVLAILGSLGRLKLGATFARPPHPCCIPYQRNINGLFGNAFANLHSILWTQLH